MKLLFKLLEKMKINVFNTQCRIGSRIRYKGKIREVYDINRLTHELCSWVVLNGSDVRK